MRIIVFGDIHGAIENLVKLKPEIESSDMVVFVGDGAKSLKVLDNKTRTRILAVRGNCDFFSGFPHEVLHDGIYITHGHQHDVKESLNAIKSAAKAKGAKICFFGHNHKPLHSTDFGIVFVNPGTLGDVRTSAPGQYAIVTINDDGKITVKHDTVM